MPHSGRLHSRGARTSLARVARKLHCFAAGAQRLSREATIPLDLPAWMVYNINVITRLKIAGGNRKKRGGKRRKNGEKDA